MTLESSDCQDYHQSPSQWWYHLQFLEECNQESAVTRQASSSHNQISLVLVSCQIRSLKANRETVTLSSCDLRIIMICIVIIIIIIIMIFTVINTIHSFWKSSSPTLLWPPARTLSLFTTTTALSEGRELWCVSREIGVQNCFYLKIPVVWSRSVEVCMEFEQVRFRKGEAVRLEGVSGSAEGNPLLQVPRNFLMDNFL